MMKTKAIDIDLVLTEMELPAISGFALLSLIMEHEIGRSIPVISMLTWYLLPFVLNLDVRKILLCFIYRS